MLRYFACDHDYICEAESNAAEEMQAQYLTLVSATASCITKAPTEKDQKQQEGTS